MARTQISIKLDDDVLERIDRLAEAAGMTRTAVIERALKNDLPEQEAFQRSLENPLTRAIHAKLTTPAMLRLIGRLANEDFTDAQLAAFAEVSPKQRESARAKSATRKRGGAASEGLS